MEQKTVRETVLTNWTDAVLPSLSGLVEIPALSPAFDASWQASGKLMAAIEHVREWITSRNLPGAKLDIIQLGERTPVLIVDVPATPGAEDKGTVLLYGHLDKQPPVGGWSEGLDPWKPVIRDGRLYGRGAVDDGYSGYAATTALEAVHAGGGAHARSVILLETAEESGSPDLPAYMEHLSERLGNVSLVVCLDAGGSDYDRLWLTTALRGMLHLSVTVRVLDSAQHSGMASGVVPSSFRILRQLLDRIEDSATGEIKLGELSVEIPANRLAEAEGLVAIAPGRIKTIFPLVEGMRPVADDDLELILNNTWRPTLSVIGASGMPEPADAGNVLRDSTTLTLSFRLPPTADAQAAMTALKKVLTEDVPYGAKVTLEDVQAENGWNAPAEAPWLTKALEQVSADVFGQPHGSAGMGGSIPFMGLLGELYPEAQFLVTGACGPDSNIHVPDEWLNIEFAKQVTEAVAYLLDAHAQG
ncbi:Acetylornithine deacetylase/Succinyl-diaminopimelate desuccinylase [Amycolatopsis xylanica]|uniref:Acetylornithine deacetylase/Succinyl-diaminopimelate desuccinylase n=1 Tax=Amycolatopsis xylanica TaxID=589385 RepID=A0A1H3AEB7_9PSEU|nr:M20/M25/M40 family metallo-hydrolase [Amycolatopsis xylanica]SDX27514.1 Acetylornithine deacetylase/Succinyl-diaminopimelate desuccinylase [Amycolatopsis xylanica]